MTIAKETIHALIPSPGSDSIRYYQTILGLPPSEAIYLISKEDLGSKETIADELGFGIGVRAARKIREGSTDSHLFAVHAENWDAEDRCYNALSSIGVEQFDLLEPLQSLSSDDLLKVRLASLNLREKKILIWENPTDGISHSSLRLFTDFLKEYSEPILINTTDRAVLYYVEKIWREFGQDLRGYSGNLESYIRTYQNEIRAATEAVTKAEHELELRQQEAEAAYLKRAVRRDQARKFADSGLPKVHRGNMKRKSQETLGKAKLANEHKVQAAQKHLQEALEQRERLSTNPI